MMGDEWVSELKTRLLPILRHAAVNLKQDFPGVTARVNSYPIGTKTSFKGMVIALECLLPDVDAETDLVSLEIVVKHLDAAPVLHAADVCWGHPSGVVEASLALEGRPLDTDSMDVLQSGIPTLVEALRTALRRGAPEGDG